MTSLRYWDSSDNFGLGYSRDQVPVLEVGEVFGLPLFFLLFLEAFSTRKEVSLEEKRANLGRKLLF